jgi:hypothetical protein
MSVNCVRTAVKTVLVPREQRVRSGSGVVLGWAGIGLELARRMGDGPGALSVNLVLDERGGVVGDNSLDWMTPVWVGGRSAQC